MLPRSRGSGKRENAKDQTRSHLGDGKTEACDAGQDGSDADKADDDVHSSVGR